MYSICKYNLGSLFLLLPAKKKKELLAVFHKMFLNSKSRKRYLKENILVIEWLKQ